MRLHHFYTLSMGISKMNQIPQQILLMIGSINDNYRSGAIQVQRIAEKFFHHFDRKLLTCLADPSHFLFHFS